MGYRSPFERRRNLQARYSSQLVSTAFALMTAIVSAWASSSSVVDNVLAVAAVTPASVISTSMCCSTSTGWYPGIPPCALDVASWARKTLWNHSIVSPGACVVVSSSYSHSTIAIVPNFFCFSPCVESLIIVSTPTESWSSSVVLHLSSVFRSSVRRVPNHRQHSHRVLVFLGCSPLVQRLQFFLEPEVAVLKHQVVDLPVVDLPLPLVSHVVLVLFHVHIHCESPVLRVYHGVILAVVRVVLVQYFRHDRDLPRISLCHQT